MNTRRLLTATLSAATVASLSVLGPSAGVATVVGRPDPTFSGNGFVRTDWGTSTGWFGVALQGDKPVVAGAVRTGGSVDAALVRYRANGTLDRSFSGDGKVRVRLDGWWTTFLDVARTADGKLLAVGVAEQASTSRMLVARFLADGRPDRAFGRQGLVHTGFGTDFGVARAVLPLPGGKVAVCGVSANESGTGSMAVARYTSRGRLDPAFGGDGKVTLAPPGHDRNICFSLAPAPGGHLVVAGDVGDQATGLRLAALARIRANGTLAPGFGTGGWVIGGGPTSSSATTVLAVDDGAAFVVGGFLTASGGTRVGFLAKFGGRGRFVTDFGTDGVVQLPVAGGEVVRVAITRHGKGYAAGGYVDMTSGTQDALLFRVTGSGRIDTAFAPGGYYAGGLATTEDSMIVDLVSMTDRRLVIAGSDTDGGVVGRQFG